MTKAALPYKFAKGDTLTSLVEEFTGPDGFFTDKKNRETYSINKIVTRKKDLINLFGKDRAEKIAPDRGFKMRGIGEALYYGKALKNEINKATQGLSKGGSVKKSKALYTRKGPCK